MMYNPQIVSRYPLGIICSPGFIVALTLLILNDHVLKYQFPGFITGKLSDFSGLFLAGLLACSLRRFHSIISLTFLALLFVWWKSPSSTALIDSWNNLNLWPVQRVVDYTDLFALASLPAAQSYWHRHRTIALARLLRIPLIVATVFAVSATSMIPRYISLSVPDPVNGHDTDSKDSALFCGVAMLHDLDEIFHINGYIPYGPYLCSYPERSGDGQHIVHRQIYKLSKGELYFTVTYDVTTKNAYMTNEGYGEYYFRADAEQLRRALRDALNQRGYFPLEGGVVVHHPPTAYTRMLITKAPLSDPLNPYPYDFRRLSLKVSDMLTELGFKAVNHPDCGNNAYFAPERICNQFITGHGDGDDGEIALTSVTFVGYMLPGQPPIEVSIVQFGTKAPFSAPALSRKLQDELQAAVPELAIQVVTEKREIDALKQ